MASAVTKAKNELIRLNNRAKALRQKQKQEARQMTNALAVLAGGAAAALVDEKFGEGEEVAEVGNVPTNAIIGGGAVVSAALVKGLPFREEIASLGLGMATTSLYQLIRQNVEFE